MRTLFSRKPDSVYLLNSADSMGSAYAFGSNRKSTSSSGGESCPVIPTIAANGSRYASSTLSASISINCSVRLTNTSLSVCAKVATNEFSPWRLNAVDVVTY